MVARKFLVHHNQSLFHVDYDTEDGLDVLKFQLFSLTLIPPDEQKIFGEKNVLISTDSELDSVAEKLRLVSIGHDGQEVEEEEAAAASSSDAADLLKSDEELARTLQAEEEALFFQQFRAGEDREEFEKRIRPYVKQVLLYEDSARQEAAHKTVPVDELEEKALVSLAKEGNFRPSKQEQDHAFLLQLLFWFKQSFRWVNAPPCDGCGIGTNFTAMGVPLPSELQFGGSRVELYRCNSCSIITRFPRFNDPFKLLETRRGRCGEWANCFTLYCRSFGYESRLILDFTDHVWTECFSEYLGRWMHLDPCEGIYDRPLLYETGWNKNLTYVIGIAKDGVHDVTRRYTRKWQEVLSRRNITTEPIASAVLFDITNECRKTLNSQAISKLEDRDRKEAKELDRGLLFQDAALISLPGRQSGAKEWRIARSELGTNDSDSLSCSSCPVRICVDDHVTKIYDAFSHLLSQLVSSGISKDITLEMLEMLKRMLVDLQKISFKVRRATIDSNSNASFFSKHQVMPYVDRLLSALSLKRASETDGRVDICLAGDPVKTSLALPVALDALDNAIFNLNNIKSFSRESLFLPLLKFNRISSGSVLASGEELPFGIATSAFDGIHISKWEEPNGGKGLLREVMMVAPAGMFWTNKLRKILKVVSSAKHLR
ncbi:peptide-N(4)-(N-acetyl-beta-glucosaminyl)asparagine amidase isoform X2 [Magnolia sinica]|uniref:peptide-N(4)-(N-acetyl-beta- glucosaminyl)asparagine amidase isoform X2 n=1 Tax=Magnolia sinica TaxID=86752 RepID=UPI002658B92A|nr:peptide-N(4)-(N-acetyl-beta-glucosaminyl)asparagine amidase isoform X2 [Magnolia sinica]